MLLIKQKYVMQYTKPLNSCVFYLCHDRVLGTHYQDVALALIAHNRTVMDLFSSDHIPMDNLL